MVDAGLADPVVVVNETVGSSGGRLGLFLDPYPEHSNLTWNAERCSTEQRPVPSELRVGSAWFCCYIQQPTKGIKRYLKQTNYTETGYSK